MHCSFVFNRKGLKKILLLKFQFQSIMDIDEASDYYESDANDGLLIYEPSESDTNDGLLYEPSENELSESCDKFTQTDDAVKCVKRVASQAGDGNINSYQYDDTPFVACVETCLLEDMTTQTDIMLYGQPSYDNHFPSTSQESWDDYYEMDVNHAEGHRLEMVNASPMDDVANPSRITTARSFDDTKSIIADLANSITISSLSSDEDDDNDSSQTCCSAVGCRHILDGKRTEPCKRVLLKFNPLSKDNSLVLSILYSEVLRMPCLESNSELSVKLMEPSHIEIAKKCWFNAPCIGVTYAKLLLFTSGNAIWHVLFQPDQTVKYIVNGNINRMTLANEINKLQSPVYTFCSGMPYDEFAQMKIEALESYTFPCKRVQAKDCLGFYVRTGGVPTTSRTANYLLPCVNCESQIRRLLVSRCLPLMDVDKEPSEPSIPVSDQRKRKRYNNNKSKNLKKSST